ncbi:MAG: ExbD/TolR family protein [Spirochaetaceae bacterium]
MSPNANVDLVPMIDVVFQLVVFFMVSSTFVMTPGIALDLPAASSDEQVVMNRLVVTVVSPEEIYLNRRELTLEGLGRALTDLARQESDGEGVRSIVLEADRDVSYELIVQVLGIMRQNGFRAVSMRTAPEESP